MAKWLFTELAFLLSSYFGLIKNKTDEAGPPTTEHQIKNLTTHIISASAYEWTLRDPSPLFLPLQPPREHSRVRLICVMIPLCITVYSITDHYPRVWHRIVCYTFSVIACWKVGHCLRVDLMLGFILFSFRLVCFGGSLWYGWVRKGGRGITDFGICYLRLLATLGMRSFGIPSEVYRKDLVWKKLITQGPRGVLSIWLIANISL